ncbi:MAG: winged helix-turn-helix domain-containing protein [Acidiferrobacterales bacterium]|nr:winged helix-turn-helix domain-containing protein [Acidiferrobacterales bacterium]
MTQQFWIGDFYIDLSRNQIRQNGDIQTLPPKALAVLSYLAQNTGAVVSHEALLKEVWQQTVVSPNSLQKSITQLRKALGDDGKEQIFIKTHAKQGYSLEAAVRWVDTESINHELTNANQQTNPNGPTKRFALLALAFLIVCVFPALFFYHGNTPNSKGQFTVESIHSITATDDKEFDASYTPDGQYILFHRYRDKQCANRIWAKHIASQQEILLTKDWGSYGSHSLSEDGKKLVFMATEPCDQPTTQKFCFDLMSLDFAQALEAPQPASIILRCKDSLVRKPRWLDNDNIAILHRSLGRWKLISYSVDQDASTELFTTTNGTLHDYAYSTQEDLIAVTHSDDNGELYIDLLTPSGAPVSSNKIKRPDTIANFTPIYPNFDSKNKRLVFSTGRRLFTLSYQGEVLEANVPLSEPMVLPEFSPSGNKLLMIKGPYDSDIAKLTFNQSELISTKAARTNTTQVVERTNLGESNALLQPNEDLIAFLSERSGEDQIWISDGSNARQITFFPLDTQIRGFDWARDGTSLLVNANGSLSRISLSGKQQVHRLKRPILWLFDWDSVGGTVLALMRIDGLVRLVDYDLSSAEPKVLTDKTVLWAQRNDDGQLVYKDRLDRYWKPGPVEPEMIRPISGIGSKPKSFLLKGSVIYNVSRENQVWSYDLETGKYTDLGRVTDSVNYLSDVKDAEFLVTVEVAARKEVVELWLE